MPSRSQARTQSKRLLDGLIGDRVAVLRGFRRLLGTKKRHFVPFLVGLSALSRQQPLLAPGLAFKPAKPGLLLFGIVSMTFSPCGDRGQGVAEKYLLQTQGTVAILGEAKLQACFACVESNRIGPSP